MKIFGVKIKHPAKKLEKALKWQEDPAGMTVKELKRLGKKIDKKAKKWDKILDD